jgi:ABC-type transport system substrate-binding protein
MRKKRWMALFMAAAMTVSTLAGCSSGSGSSTTSTTAAGQGTGTQETAAEVGERKVVIGETLDPETLTPYSPLYSDRYALLCMLYQPLMLVAGNQQYNVMIRELEEVTERSFKVHLYDNIYDTAGNHFTSSDVLFSYQLAQDSGNFSKLGALTNIEALDDYTVEFDFGENMIFGQINAVLSQVFMVTQAAYEASGDQMAINAVGTTGYVVDSYTEGSSIVFKKAENGYWQTAKEGEDGYVPFYDADKLDVVEYDFITESSQMAIALESGSIDIADRISSTDVALFQNGKSNVDVHENVGEFYTLTYNCSEEAPFNNENLRKAVAYSWDAQGIVDGAFDGAGEPATALNNHYRLDYNPEYDTRDYFGYNPDTAKEYLQKYLDETGKTASDVSITIMVANNEYLERVAQIMQAYVLELGINCEMVSYDNVTRKTIRNSREGWDIAIAKDTAVNQYYVDTMAMQYDRTTGKSLAGGWIDDDELHALMLAGVSPETHSTETVSAFEDFMQDHCYAVGVCIDTAYAGSNKVVTNFVTGAYDVVSPCACTYDWSAK